MVAVSSGQVCFAVSSCQQIATISQRSLLVCDAKIVHGSSSLESYLFFCIINKPVVQLDTARAG